MIRQTIQLTLRRFAPRTVRAKFLAISISLAFLIAVMLQLEHIGFCARGEGSQFLLDTDITFNGELPINTGGGQISAGQPGLAGGQLNLIEAIRQMFGEAGERQVSDPRNAMVTGIGVIPYVRNWGSSAVMILENGS